ncbi:MAG: hypothetical protein JW827_06620 [Spirochaetes bacterium]|nr:hypothetical protein [Spirochaetota bacterium]
MDIIIGFILIILSLVFLIYIVLWSRRTINLICDREPSSSRKIARELKNG